MKGSEPMGVGEIVFGCIAVAGAVYAFLSSRRERHVSLAEVAIKLVDPLSDRLEAIEAELDGAHKQIEKLERCLDCHGIRIEDCP